MQTIFKCDVKQWYNGVTSLVAGDGVRVVVWRFLADVCNLVETLLWFTRIHRQCPHRKVCILIRRHLVHCRLPLLLNHRPFMTRYIYFCICKRINCKIHFSDWLSKSAKLFFFDCDGQLFWKESQFSNSYFTNVISTYGENGKFLNNSVDTWLWHIEKLIGLFW